MIESGTRLHDEEELSTADLAADRGVARPQEFGGFAHSLKGDEKGEAQTFLDHFFRALGHKGVIEVGAMFEFRIAKKPGSSR